MDVSELRRARDKAGLTSAQMAARLGVKVDTYRSWELGRRQPREDIMLAVLAIAAGEPTPRDEVAGLREIVRALQAEVAALNDRSTELALIVVSHAAELERLRNALPPR